MLRYSDIETAPIVQLLAQFAMQLITVKSGEPIPGSFWGDDEAGLVASRLYARGDTPVHSMLHEACHYICMPASRRTALDTNAGGDYDEENAVCYLQILLSDHVPEMGRSRMFADMDDWGYSFRLGSAQAWFEQDAEDAQQWLLDAGLIDTSGKPAWRLRQT